MESKKKVTIAAASVLAAGAAAAGIAVAGGGDDNEAPIKGSALDKASEVALEETGGGTVTDTEAGDEESYYEVEVTLDEVGRTFNVTRERIRQIENQSLKKLQSLAEAQKLRDVA